MNKKELKEVGKAVVGFAVLFLLIWVMNKVLY